METGRVDCECGDQIISNSGKTMNSAEDWKKIACWGCGKLYKYDDIERVRIEGQAVIFHPMKVFRMNDCDWWMDTDLEAAKKNYLGFLETEPEAVEDAREMTNEEMDNHTYYVEDNYGMLYPKYTFREHMNSIDQKSQFFASTEY